MRGVAGLLSTTSGGERNALGRGADCCAAVTLARQRVLVHLERERGPARGVLAILTYFEFSVALRMMKCDTPNGPATCTKSLSLFVLDSLRFLAVCGSSRRTSSVSSFTSSLSCRAS